MTYTKELPNPLSPPKTGLMCWDPEQEELLSKNVEELSSGFTQCKLWDLGLLI